MEKHAARESPRHNPYRPQPCLPRLSETERERAALGPQEILQLLTVGHGLERRGQLLDELPVAGVDVREVAVRVVRQKGVRHSNEAIGLADLVVLAGAHVATGGDVGA